jgi:hypothetical protein
VLQFFLKDGKGKETRISPNSEIGQSLDDLFDAFGLAKAVNNGLKGLPEIMDYANTAIEQLGLNEEGYQNSKNYFDGKVEPNVPKKEIKGVGADGQFEYTENTVVSTVSQEGDTVTHYVLNKQGDTIRSNSAIAIERKSEVMKLFTKPTLKDSKEPVKNPRK